MTQNDIFVLIKWTTYTRIAIFVLQVVVSLFPDHQHSMDDVFMSDKRYPPHPPFIETLFGGFDNWDSEYFMHIAEHGYQYEQCHAFFPLYPLLMRYLAIALYQVIPQTSLLPFRSIVLISGFVISNVSFIAAAVTLYFLSVQLFSISSIVPQFSNKRLSILLIQRVSFLSVLLFTVNPAVVFTSSVYTESLFVCLSFLGMLAVSHSRLYIAAVMFALSSATRSNGVVLSGFIIYYHLLAMVKSDTRSMAGMGLRLWKMFIQVSIVFLPFVMFQYYSYHKLCHIDAVPRSSLPLVCNWSLPLPYSYIQATHWGVGFLKYYQLKQIPNFILAAPMITVSVYAVWFYVYTIKTDKRLQLDFVFLPYIVQLTFLILFCVFFMHIQVATRFIASSSPVIYWLPAVIDVKVTHKSDGSPRSPLLVLVELVSYRSSGITRCIVIYYLTYCVIGIALHCNFLPWT
jgi:phosphatidylinositol glycan class V